MTMQSNTTRSPAPSPYVREVTVQNFMSEVIQASLATQVLAYFTAAWCGPCKQYGPMLEKVVNEAKGKMRLARIDIDKNPQLAQQFRIQSVPMVYVFVQGQPLDAFAGVLPESQLKEMIAQLAAGGPEALETAATLGAAQQLLAEGRPAEAEEIFQAIAAQEPDNMDAIAGLARSVIAQAKLADAKALLATVPEAKQNHEAVAAAREALALAESAPKKADEAKLRKAVAANPQDHQARYELASALFAGGAQEEAMGELLAIIAKNKDWNEGEARKLLLTFFEALGHTHPLTMQGRRKLSSILFA